MQPTSAVPGDTSRSAIRERRTPPAGQADISLHPDFAELLGFTEAEVRGLLERYRDLGVFDTRDRRTT